MVLKHKEVFVYTLSQTSKCVLKILTWKQSAEKNLSTLTFLLDFNNGEVQSLFP